MIKIFINGGWVDATIYIYSNGQWRQATAYIYNQQWKEV